MLGGWHYYVSFTDDWSRWTVVCLLRQKSEAFKAFKDFYAWVLTQLEKRVKCLHMDRGGEYLSDAFISFLDKKGIEQKLTVHDTPENNGVVERLNHTLIEKVRAMMISSQSPRGLWGEALMHTVWLKNHTWTRALPTGITPYELMMGQTPALHDVPEWGSVIWVHNTSSGKLSIWANEGHWVGYDLNSDGHRVYWKERRMVTVERNVIFSKNDIPQIEDLLVDGIMVEPEGEKNDNGIQITETSPNPESTRTENQVSDNAINILANPTLPDIRQSQWDRKPSRYIQDLNSGEFTTSSKNEKFPKGLQLPKLNEEIVRLQCWRE
jgi:hypothetical protein